MIDHPAFSRLGFGVTGPHASRFTPKAPVIARIRDALDAGITYFDTGPAYGNGRGEARLGEALKGVAREQVFISTKAGVQAGGVRDFSPGAVEMSLKASLDRLGMGYVDLLLLHGPAPDEVTDRLIRHLEAFRARGLFRYLGICGRGPELETAIHSDAINAIMAPLNAQLSDAELTRLQACKAADISLIGIEALKGATPSSRLPLGPMSAWYFARSVKQRLTGQAADGTGQSPQAALRFALDHPLSDSVVSLTTKSAHLHANAQLAGLNPPLAQPSS
ncbi:MAG: aldo/keto reductase [Alphaproteobacteria bacterium]|nr:aldo/keto reductase [Alphaproteobacteria bacterium]